MRVIFQGKLKAESYSQIVLYKNATLNIRTYATSRSLSALGTNLCDTWIQMAQSF